MGGSPGGVWVGLDTVHGSFWKNLDTQHSQWHPALGGVAVEVPQIQFVDDDMVGYCWAWCLVRQWIHGLRQVLGAFGRFSLWRRTRIPRSILVLLSWGPRYAVWRSVHSLCFRLLELLHFDILTLFPRTSRI